MAKAKEDLELEDDHRMTVDKLINKLKKVQKSGGGKYLVKQSDEAELTDVLVIWNIDNDTYVVLDTGE